MTGDRTAPAGADLDSLLGRVADDFLVRQERGEAPDPEEYAARHPEAADLIRRALGSLRLVESAGDGPPPSGGPPVAGVLGDFRIVREVGRGGMGVVYQAEQLSLRRRVALKVLPFAAVMDPRSLQRFKNEALAAAGLDHPHVVKVHAVGEDRGVHYLAMQFVEGRSLADLVAERRGDAIPAGSRDATAALGPDPTPPAAARSGSRTPADVAYLRRVAEWGAQAADALEHAHALGVVHRDVKPANLLVDARGHLYVADFGLAQVAADPGLTTTGDILGTPRYMSPEQAGARHNLVDHRTDVYALGATLYELLTLAPAVPGDTRAEVLRRVAEADPVTPRAVDRRVPWDLETVVLKCLEKDPARRYPSARELADDLRRWLSGNSVKARRPTAVHRVGRWVGRHRTAVAAALAVVMLAGVGSAVALVQVSAAYAAERDARRDEQAAAEQARKRLAQVERGNEVLAGVFADLDPNAEEKEGRPLRAILGDRLVRAAERLDEAAGDDPLVLAGLQDRLGVSLIALGHPEPAVPLIERARAARIAALGPTHPDALTSTRNLACAYHAVDREVDALPLYEEALTLRRAHLGPAHSDTLTSVNDLGRVYTDTGQLDRARRMFEEGLALGRAHLGPDHPDTLTSINNLGVSHLQAGRAAAAVPLLEEALALYRKRPPGSKHLDTAACMNNLAHACERVGQRDRALSLFEEALALQRARLGPDHWLTLRAVDNLAGALLEAGRVKLALPMLEENLVMCRAKLGADHHETATAINSMANCYSKVGRHSDAVRLGSEALAWATQRRGPDDALTLSCMNNLAFYYARADRPAEAIPLFEEVFRKGRGRGHPGLDGVGEPLSVAYARVGRTADAAATALRHLADTRGQYPPGSQELGTFLAVEGRFLVECGAFAEAEPVLREALAVRERLAPADWRTANARSLLGGALLGQGKYTEAEPLLVAGYHGLDAAGAAALPHARGNLPETADRLVELYRALDQPDEVRRWRAERAKYPAPLAPPPRPAGP